MSKARLQAPGYRAPILTWSLGPGAWSLGLDIRHSSFVLSLFRVFVIRCSHRPPTQLAGTLTVRLVMLTSEPAQNVSDGEKLPSCGICHWMIVAPPLASARA